jgi:sodium transport system ATP-binding protein
MPVLKVKNLTKKFEISDQERKTLGTKEKYKVAVDNISFEIHSGDVFGLLGPNGAGKTTTMKMLSTLLKPTSGEIFYDGVSISSNPIQIRSEFAFLTSELKLDPQSTPNDMFDFFAALYHIPVNVAADRKKKLFDRFGIHEFAERKINKLSQGMKQKTSLAISVLHDPKFIIFDEPTNGLDVLASKDVREFIINMRDEGKCIIVSTHIFDLIERTCNKVALIVDGKIIKNDTLEYVMNGKSLEDAFYDIYTEHMKGQEAQA